jgi:hypothetical protein
MGCHLLRLARLGLALSATGILLADAPVLAFTAGGAWPTGQTRSAYTDRMGLSVGASAEWEISPGHGTRLALDGTFHAQDHPGGTDGGRVQSQALTLGYVFRPRAELQGAYFLLGAGAMNVQDRSGGLFRETGVKLAWYAGAGLDLDDRWGLLARFLGTTERDQHACMVTAGLTYRF